MSWHYWHFLHLSAEFEFIFSGSWFRNLFPSQLPSIFTLLCHLIGLIFSRFLWLSLKEFYFCSIFQPISAGIVCVCTSSSSFYRLIIHNWIQRNAPQCENHTVDGCLKYPVPSCFIFKSRSLIPCPQQYCNGLLSLHHFRNTCPFLSTCKTYQFLYTFFSAISGFRNQEPLYQKFHELRCKYSLLESDPRTDSGIRGHTPIWASL